MEVRGVDQFQRLSKALKEAGNRELRLELNRALREAAKPFVADVRRAASRLPDRGGFSRRVARTPIRVQKRSQNGIRVQARSPWGIGQVDKGILWHPVWGNRDVWVRQTVQSGFWSDPAKDNEAEVRREMQHALSRIVAKIDHAV